MVAGMVWLIVYLRRFLLWSILLVSTESSTYVLPTWSLSCVILCVVSLLGTLLVSTLRATVWATPCGAFPCVPLPVYLLCVSRPPSSLSLSSSPAEQIHLTESP